MRFKQIFLTAEKNEIFQSKMILFLSLLKTNKIHLLPIVLVSTQEAAAPHKSLAITKQLSEMLNHKLNK